MEYTQWAVKFAKMSTKKLVLILVVMEYTQWAKKDNEAGEKIVLILVVMEYTQWESLNLSTSVT